MHMIHLSGSYLEACSTNAILHYDACVNYFGLLLAVLLNFYKCNALNVCNHVNGFNAEMHLMYWCCKVAKKCNVIHGMHVTNYIVHLYPF